MPGARLCAVARVIYGTMALAISSPRVLSRMARMSRSSVPGEDAKTAAMARISPVNGAGLETGQSGCRLCDLGEGGFQLCDDCFLAERRAALDDDEMKALVMATIMEACDVASAAGVEVDREGLRATIEMVHREHRDHKPSMLVDVENRRRTEIDALNGAVVATGARLGVPTPRNQTLLALIHGREADYTGN